MPGCHGRDHGNAGLDKTGDLLDKATARGFELAKAVDHGQLHAVGQRLAQHHAGLGQGLRVQAAGL